MKRRDFIRYIERNRCELLREGGNHSIYVNIEERKLSTIPRHRDIDENLIRKICKDLGIQSCI
ncbi:MAG: type II toxin-antitoxin system HicA family toxin [Nitrospirota bacterium]|uniref:type II toxin-antitoxin system HicA family toxin n=1 Tax=Candidatus Magnetominusculus xianensis TaxID=1748249 RepID=UPI000A103E2C|nr:type II toxin-antitoxin system HicA family toxin [Nitrospirota bacterium]